MSTTTTRVVILGGGMGGLACAWGLASRPDAERWSITLYERAPRLGGKGASVRNGARHRRIEEHGLHVLMGFYDETFHLLREVYRSVADAPVLDWADALRGWDEAVLADPRRDGTYGFWRLRMPPNHRRIGGPPRPVRYGRLLVSAFAWLRRWLAAMPGIAVPPTACLAPALRDLGRGSRDADSAGALQAWLCDALGRAFEAAEPRLAEDAVRRLWIGIWFAGTQILGLLADGIAWPPYDFRRIDDHDYRTWLRDRSPFPVPPDLGWDSPPVRAVYDLAFSLTSTLGAGTAVRAALRIALGYRGHLTYRMGAGMGEVVFAPLYLALQRRGVEFRFLHEVSAIGVSRAEATVDRIAVQPRRAPAGHTPLVELRLGERTLVCWPSGVDEEPLPEEAPLELRRGRDFDVAVLALPIGAMPGPCDEIAERVPGFAAMMQGLETCSTLSLQLWADSDAAGLGADATGPMLISHARPFNSIADFSHLIAIEDWGRGAPGMLAYFCDVDDETEDAAVVADGYVSRRLPALWPRFRAEHERARFVRANRAGTDRYVLATAGSSRFRRAPDASGLRNLALAGDWTRSALDAGCLEAAVQSGLAAAEAIATGAVHG